MSVPVPVPVLTVTWTEAATVRTARWHSESAAPPPARVVVVDDRTTAATALRLAREGTGLLWRGDFPGARQLLAALGRRIARAAPPAPQDPLQAFRHGRRARADRARVLGRLFVLLDAGHSLNLRRAPDVRDACREAYGPADDTMAVPLTELLGVLGAHQWRIKGVEVPALGARIHPHYGVFAPVRGEYVQLVAEAPVPGGCRTAFDLGTGTGVLAAVLARRGVGRVVATDIGRRALDCARANVSRLGLAGRVDVVGPALYPGHHEGRAELVVCNPPWLPGSPVSELEYGVYDPDSAMLHAFLDGLAARLAPGGEGWLVLSDLAERLGLRAPGALPGWITEAGLRVAGRLDTRPAHPRSRDTADPLHPHRAAEVVSLWRLTAG
ncbi:methyltransferase [Streptomyces sp. NPDC056716]|uniref:methyltransferase n=1 Tax=unclassified Streptomyces TaxID=2593676 RepID=UPI00367A5F9A